MCGCGGGGYEGFSADCPSVGRLGHHEDQIDFPDRKIFLHRTRFHFQARWRDCAEAQHFFAYVVRTCVLVVLAVVVTAYRVRAP